jgi:hypothetical protein
MNPGLKIRIYETLRDFVWAINKDDRQRLWEEFDVSSNLTEEIREMIAEYYPGEKFSLGISPFELAFSKEGVARPNIELFEMNEGGRWGVECILWNKDAPSEPILHVEFLDAPSGLKLSYKYIGS